MAEKVQVAAFARNTNTGAVKPRSDFVPENKHYQNNRPRSNEKKYEKKQFNQKDEMKYQPKQYQRNHREEKQCYGCKEYGHIRPDCQNIRYSNCDQRGHLNYMCYRKTSYSNILFFLIF